MAHIKVGQLTPINGLFVILYTLLSLLFSQVLSLSLSLSHILAPLYILNNFAYFQLIMLLFDAVKARLQGFLPRP